MNTYFKNIQIGIKTTWVGMKLTLKHLWQARYRRREHNIRESDYFFENTGMVTLQYPLETMPIPDNGRYRLHNEMDDCIVCDKCAKVCPVDCIEIEPIKATEEVGRASDGSPIRLYAAKFDIDMAKCCYCGLCTTVCPTECLTMTKTFDYSEFDIRDMNYHYANLTPEQATEKKMLYEQFVKEKEALKSGELSGKVKVESVAFKEPESSNAKPGVDVEAKPDVDVKTETPTARPKPVFVPKKPITKEPESSNAKPDVDVKTETPTARPKPVFRPTMKPKD
jgi:formate hydrogenlyase subunit 6/NADH:ubiquinone oxidoreductase subunit I